MNYEFKVSIIVVSLNTKKKFIKTINSIKNQIYKNYEIIVVDGKSNDGTVRIIKKNEFKINKFLIERDEGIYDAMNKGIKIASGEWIIFLNSGDIFFDNFVLKKVNKLLMNNVDLLFGDTLINNEFLYLAKAQKVSKNISNMPFCHQSVLCKSSLLKKKLFNLEYHICSDFDFILNCVLTNKKFKYYPNLISTVEAGGLSDTRRFKAHFEYFKILTRNSNFKKSYLPFLISFSLLCLKTIIKKILPNYLNKKIIKIKYKSKNKKK
jgi:glycosyltransferase involved in cell wall biosynthesis